MTWQNKCFFYLSQFMFRLQYSQPRPTALFHYTSPDFYQE